MCVHTLNLGITSNGIYLSNLFFQEEDTNKKKNGEKYSVAFNEEKNRE